MVSPSAVAPLARGLPAGLVLGVLQLFLVALAIRCGYLQLGRGEELQQKQARSLLVHRKETARRGNISTRDGLVLAHDIPIWQIGFDPQLAAGSVDEIPREHRRARVRRALQSMDFAPLRWRQSRQQVIELALEKLDRGGAYVKLGVVEEHADYLSFQSWRSRRVRAHGRALAACFTIDLDARRERPQGGLALQVVGMTSKDGHGLNGIELSEDRRLRGVAGARQLDRLPGRTWMEGESRRHVPTLHGEDLVLTLDARLQGLLEHLLAKAHQEHNAAGTAGVLVDPRDGAILAMASTPLPQPESYFDPGKAKERAQWQCKVTHANWEPGSTIKGLILAQAIESGFDLNQQVTDGDKTWQVGSRTIRDSSIHEPLSIEESVIHSSNIGLARVGRMLGPDRLDYCLDRFGLGRPTGCELWEDKGSTPRTWRSGSVLSVAFGYELAATPLQMTRAYCALVNGGYLVTPHVILSQGGEEVDHPRQEILPDWVSQRVRGILRQAVLRGTGRRLDGEAIQLAGKTGTAKVAGPGGYLEGEYRSSFVGFVPWENPRYLAFVVVDRPRGEAYYGGAVAGPIVRKLLGFLMGEDLPELRLAIEHAMRDDHRAEDPGRERDPASAPLEGSGNDSMIGHYDRSPSVLSGALVAPVGLGVAGPGVSGVDVVPASTTSHRLPARATQKTTERSTERSTERAEPIDDTSRHVDDGLHVVPSHGDPPRGIPAAVDASAGDPSAARE